MTIRFNFPHQVGTELDCIADALKRGRLAGDGPYTKLASERLNARLATESVLLTHSCTAALEMCAMLAGIESGDEIIMPSYTFVSTANAFVLRGGVPVFVDVRPDTLNIDERLIVDAITPRTKAIVAVHYAGVACEMDTICEIARAHNLLVIEDAAQALGATYKGRQLGTIGDLGTFSFHETKNIVAGEGGALAINNPRFVERAEIIREKGTDRSRFFRGEIDKYTWVDIGSSFLPSEVVAAFLYAQLDHVDEINAARMNIWNRYHAAFAQLESRGLVRRPIIPEDAGHNAHIYYLVANSATEQAALIAGLNSVGINAVFHYIPLHETAAGKKFTRVGSTMAITNDLPWRIVRLPVYPDLSDSQVETVIAEVTRVLEDVAVASSVLGELGATSPSA